MKTVHWNFSFSFILLLSTITLLLLVGEQFLSLRYKNVVSVCSQDLLVMERASNSKRFFRTNNLRKNEVSSNSIKTLPENYSKKVPAELKINKVVQIKENSQKKLLVVGILSKLSAFERRSAVRYTWKKICHQRSDIVCKFFTDSLGGVDNETKAKVQEEEDIYKDLLFMPYKGGHNFALRLVWMMQWFHKQHRFRYFLRVDDDYFICMDRLLYELPHRPTRGLYWGYVHCRKHVVRVDEGWMLLSRDIIAEALSKVNKTLPCHPYGDQAVALWIGASHLNITYFYDNPRVVHAATAFQEQNFTRPDICSDYLALHGAYPLQMLRYWILTRERKQNEYNITQIPRFSDVCEFDKKFDWRWFYPHVRFEPKPCRLQPTWSITDSEFKGREYKGHEVIY